MARQIVTQQAVTEAAEALIAEGVEPSIVAVQSRIGGGSYSTVKRYLDGWRQQREEASAAVLETPVEVQAKAQEIARVVWALASRQAQAEAQQAKAEAQAEVAAARAELLEATNEIARLEAVEAAQSSTIDQQAARLREVELLLAKADVQARRVAEMEAELLEAREMAARLAGRLEVLESQQQARP